MADAASSLEKHALERKEKLKALKAKKAEKNEEEEKGTEKPQKALKFRSYMPIDDTLKEKKLPKAKPESVVEQVSDQLETAKNPKLGDVNLTNLAPRKVDWDLKRDISKKLDKLERRTQKAILELLRDKYKQDDNLAEAVESFGNSGEDLKTTDLN